MKYQVAITAPAPTITALLDVHGYLVDREASIAEAYANHAHRPTFIYPAEGASSAEVIDQVFAELEQVGAKPAGVRVSVRPVEVVKP